MITYGIAFKIIILLIFIPFIIKSIKKKRSFGYHLVFLGFIGYIITLVGVLFFPIIYDKSVFINPEANNPSINIIPFNTVLSILENDPSTFIRQVLGNIIIFIPMGFFLPVYISRLKRLKSCFFAVLSLTVIIELTQLLLDFILVKNYRCCDIDDVILNAIGGMIGYAIFSIVKRFYFRLSTKPPVSG